MQLQGGIHRYLEEYPNPAESQFIGKNFVFDGRIGVPIYKYDRLRLPPPDHQSASCDNISVPSLFPSRDDENPTRLKIDEGYNGNVRDCNFANPCPSYQPTEGISCHDVSNNDSDSSLALVGEQNGKADRVYGGGGRGGAALQGSNDEENIVGTTVGRCIECSLPYDIYNRDVVCSVCGIQVLVCLLCRGSSVRAVRQGVDTNERVGLGSKKRGRPANESWSEITSGCPIEGPDDYDRDGSCDSDRDVSSCDQIAMDTDENAKDFYCDRHRCDDMRVTWFILRGS